MAAPKPQKTWADFLVMSISPALIIVLLESLCLFLVMVFYRGEGVASVRWVLFWFTLAVVLVCRIGIEEGAGKAITYGLMLAGVTWLYLLTVHPAYLLGAALLLLLWGCAHVLTNNCTLMDDIEAASDQGLWQTAWSKKNGAAQAALPPAAVAKQLKLGEKPPKPRRRPRAPGVWLIYFSLAALPLFGLGEALLPANALAERHRSLVYLWCYLGAALGLLLTTCFLGLRHYLRERFLPMSGRMVSGWLRFGVGSALVMMALAWLVPRPGVTTAWHSLGYQIDYRIRQADAYALRFNPHGKGNGQPGSRGQADNGSETSDAKAQSNQSAPGAEAAPSPPAAGAASADGQPQTGGSDPASVPPVPAPSEGSVKLFRAVVWIVGVALIAWWLWRQRELLRQIIRSVWAGLMNLFRDFFDLLPRRRPETVQRPAPARLLPFTTYKNPFVTGSDRVWSREQLVLYSYAAVLSWAGQQGRKPAPHKTAREFCRDLAVQFPDLAADWEQLSFLQGHAAFGHAVPPGAEVESLRRIWQRMTVV